MINKIKDKIDNYLGVDTLQFFDGINMARIFGGAVRDSIAEQDIHDVDILCGAESEKGIIVKLQRLGYKNFPTLGKVDMSATYKSRNSKINEPKTFIKGDSIVQLIRPKSILNDDLKGSDRQCEYLKLYKNLLSGVDISCCGVSFDGEKLYENFPNAVLHCLIKKFHINQDSIFINPERINDRKHKLIERGWSESMYNKQDKRDISIDMLLSNNNIDFIQEYNNKYTSSLSFDKNKFVKWVVENSKSF